MVKFFPKFYITLGSAGNSSVYVKDGNGDWQEFINYEYFKVKKKQNQISEFEIQIMDLEAAEKVYVKEFADVLFFSENNLILKGRIQKITYETAYDSLVIGFGMEAKLLEKELIKSNDKRVQYTNESAQTIAKEILSSNTDGASPWIITPNTGGLFATDYGNLSIRYEYGNRLNSIVKLTEAIDYEWGISQGDVYSDDFFDIVPLLPNSTRATVSQETFEITGANANCYQTGHEKDITNLANKIDVLGYGDGVNQKHTSTYNASETFSTLASDITSSSTTITLVDASSFDSSGEIRIAEERITYAGKSGNDLTGCTRGTSSTIALAHKKNVYAEKYVAISSAEAGSSIGTNGLMDYTITERDIIDVETLELIASRELLVKMDPIVRIIIMPNEPLETAGNRKIGDLITITDAESDLSDDYRIVGMNYVSDYGDLNLEIEASNRSLTFIEQMQKQKEANENLSKYMQGSTNIYAINEAENCDNSIPLNLRFYLPSEAIAINKVLLSFKLKDYRSYTAATQTSATSDTTESLNKFDLWYDVGQTEDTSGSSAFINLTVPSSFVETFSGAVVSIQIINRTGSNDTYDWAVTNETESTTLDSGSNWSINNGSGSIRNFHYDTGEVSVGDTIRFTVSDGILGTSSGWQVLGGFSMVVQSDSAHSHSITTSYEMNEETLSTPSIDLSVGAEGSETAIDTYTSDQEDIDITSAVSGVGAGNWINIKFDPNKRMRIEANAYIQIFIESK